MVTYLRRQGGIKKESLDEELLGCHLWKLCGINIQQKQKIKTTWTQEKLTGIATTVWLIEIIYTPNRSAEAQVEEKSPTQGTIVIC